MRGRRDLCLEGTAPVVGHPSRGTTIRGIQYLQGMSDPSPDTTKKPTGTPVTGGSRRRNIVLVILLVLGLIYLLVREEPEPSRAPVPTPTSENVHEIAP